MEERSHSVYSENSWRQRDFEKTTPCVKVPITRVQTIKQVSALPQEDVLELRYEDLCDDCHGILRKLLEFVGLEVSAFPFDRVPASIEPTNKRWLANVDPTELQLLEERLERSLSRYGYLASASTHKAERGPLLTKRPPAA